MTNDEGSSDDDDLNRFSDVDEEDSDEESDEGSVNGNVEGAFDLMRHESITASAGCGDQEGSS